MGSHASDQKESSVESVIATSEALESVKIKIENDINDEMSESSMDRKTHISSDPLTQDLAVIPALVNELTESLMKATQKLDDTNKVGETGEQISSHETDSSIEHIDLGEISGVSIIPFNKANTDCTKNEDSNICKHEKSKSSDESVKPFDKFKADQQMKYRMAKFHIDQAMRCLNLNSDPTEPIARKVVPSDTETNSPNSSQSSADAETNSGKANISMPIIGDIEAGNEQQIFKCDKCEPILCFESRDALKSHVEQVHGITQ